MTNGFALNHYKSLKIHFFCVKCQAKNNFLKDVESTVANEICFIGFSYFIPEKMDLTFHP